MQAKPLFGGWRLFGALAAAVIALCAAILALHPDPVQATRLVIRVTAYTSFVPFLLAFVASSAATLAPGGFTRELMRERRYLGLSFAFSHLVHLIAIFSYGAMNPAFWPSRSVAVNTPGTIGYVFIALLTTTSFRYFARHISGQAWKRLHTAGVWVIAAVYALSFIKRIPSVSVLYAIPLAILCIAIAIRVIGKRARKRKQALIRSNGNTHRLSPQTLESI